MTTQPGYDSHEIARRVAVLYEDVVTRPIRVTCFPSRGSFDSLRLHDSEITTSDLMKRPLVKNLQGHRIHLSARVYPDGGPNLIEVEMKLDGRTRRTIVPLERATAASVYWTRLDYRFSLQVEKAPGTDGIACATTPHPSFPGRSQTVHGEF